MAVSHCAVPPAQSASVSTFKGPTSPPQRTTDMDNTHPNGHKERQDQLQQLSIATSSSSSSPSSSPSPQPSLFTPIWDYDRFPVGPCVRRLSQEQQNPFLIDYSQQHHHHRSQSSSASSSKAMMRSASSSSSTGDATVVSTSPVTGPHSRRGSRHYESNKQTSRNVSGGQSVLGGGSSSVGGSSGMVIGTSHGLPTGTTTSALNGVVSFSCSPSSAHIPHTHIHTHTCMGVATADAAVSAAAAADAAANQEHQPQQESSSWSSSPPATISKFDQYIAQKERIRSTRASTTSLSSSSGRGPATAIHSTTLNNTTTTPSPALASASASASYPSRPATITATSSPAKKTGSFFPRLFKSKSKNNNTKARRDRRTDPTQPQPQLPTTPSSGTRSHDSSMRQQETLPSSPGSCSSSSQSSLLHEKEAAHFLTRRRQPSTSDPEKTGLAPTGRTNTTAPAITTAGAGTSAAVGTSQSPIQAQQDRWRDEWLRPSGAIHSMFRDRPSKFNCPHCGAIKVVSHIQFVPGVMSYLVAFGLLFLTLGTLSYLPFRKDHEGTKDCLHWCPECGRKVARFNRANSTWEWV